MDFGGIAPPPGALTKALAPTGAKTEAQTNAAYYLGVTLVLDTEFQAHYAPNAPSTAVGILNIVDGFYSVQADTHVYLYALKTLASNGTLTITHPSTLLDAFSLYSQQSLPFSGVAHLLSGKDFNGNTVGLAWIGTLCSSSHGTGVDEVTYSPAAGAATLAHEMGHNYGALHDSAGPNSNAGLPGNSCPASGYIMNAFTSLNSPPSEFSGCSLDYFHSYLTNNSASCLAPRPDRIFADGFD